MTATMCWPATHHQLKTPFPQEQKDQHSLPSKLTYPGAAPVNSKPVNSKMVYQPANQQHVLTTTKVQRAHFRHIDHNQPPLFIIEQEQCKSFAKLCLLHLHHDHAS